MKKFSPLLLGLIVSLIANALLAGLLIGGLLGKPRHGDRGPGRGDPDFAIARGIQSVVPESERDEIRSAFMTAFGESRELIDEKREAQRRLSEALVAEPFSQSDVDQAFADIRMADLVLKERFQATLSDELAKIDPAERRALGEWLRQVEERRGRFHGRRGDGERGWRRRPPDEGPPPQPEP
ncbi:MAG: periplasmic heavy metal sensor [Henriciella sp.]